MIPMMSNISQHLRAYFGWCPNCPGIHVQASDHATGRGATGISDPEPPRPGTIPARITVPAWMNATALIILFATCFVGGNIWWPFFVGAVLIVCLVCWYYRHIREVQ